MIGHLITCHKWRLTWQLNVDIADRRVTGAGAFTRQRASMSIGTTRNTASGAVRRPMVRAAFIRRRASIGMVPARTSAFGAARPPTASAASTARPDGMRSKIEEGLRFYLVSKGENMSNCPEGYFDAGMKIDDNGSIGEWSCQGDLAITKLWIPNTVTSVGNRAFGGCTNLSEIKFEDGGTLPLTLGAMSFAKCTSLSSLALPARTVYIGDGCFRDSTALESVEIGEGMSPLRAGCHLFDNCVGSETMKETIAREVARRNAVQPHVAPAGNRRGATCVNAVLQGLRLKMPNGQMDPAAISRGLESVYDIMSKDPDFPFETELRDYEEASKHFSAIEDWAVVSEDELRSVMVGGYIGKVANLNHGDVTKAEFQAADKGVFREICSALHDLVGTDAEDGAVAKLEDRYNEQFLATTRHPAAFHRMIAAIKPELVVRVSAIEKLTPVYAWFTGSDVEDVENNEWYRISRCVRAKLQELLPGKSIYQVGVFAWFLAEAFRDDLENDAAKRRKTKVLDALRGAGLL